MQKFEYISTNRRIREDRRFVAGSGKYAADIVRPGTLHVAALASQYPAANIAVDASDALKLPGVHYVLAGDELAKGTDPLMNGLDTPRVRRYPLAVGRCVTRENGSLLLSPRRARSLKMPARKCVCTMSRCPTSSTLRRPINRGVRRFIPITAPTYCSIESLPGVTSSSAPRSRRIRFRFAWCGDAVPRSRSKRLEVLFALWNSWQNVLDVWASNSDAKICRPDSARHAFADERGPHAPRTWTWAAAMVSSAA